MSPQSKKGKEKKKQQGVPLSKSRLVQGGETGNRDDGRGRKLSRVIKDAQIAGQSVSHVTSFLSTYHGEQFVKAIPDWFKEVLTPLILATDHSMRIMLASATMAAISVDIEIATFEDGLLTLIDRINKRVAREAIKKDLPPKRVISYAYYDPNPPTREKQHNIQGKMVHFCIIVCLPGHLNMPKQLEEDYAEFYLRMGKYDGLNPLTSEVWLERSRQSFNEFQDESIANPLNDPIKE